MEKTQCVHHCHWNDVKTYLCSYHTAVTRSRDKSMVKLNKALKRFKMQPTTKPCKEPSKKKKKKRKKNGVYCVAALSSQRLSTTYSYSSSQKFTSFSKFSKRSNFLSIWSWKKFCVSGSWHCTPRDLFKFGEFEVIRCYLFPIDMYLLLLWNTIF